MGICQFFFHEYLFSKLPRMECQVFWPHVAHPPKSQYLLEHVCERIAKGKLQDMLHRASGKSRITNMASEHAKQLDLKFGL